MTNKYGLLIKTHRIENKLTQTELGQKLGVTSACVSAWEVGRNEPNMNQVCKMADIFGCEVEDLMGRKHDVWADTPVQDKAVAMLHAYEAKVDEFNSEDEKRLMKMFRTFAPEQQRRLLDCAIDIMMEGK